MTPGAPRNANIESKSWLWEWVRLHLGGWVNGIPESNSLVIRNAVEKVEFHEKPKDKINLIYHTTPWRGLENLLKIFKNLNLSNVELNVCSSVKIYGKKFEDIYAQKYQNLFEQCKSTKNVNYLGFVDNKNIIELLKKTHIYAFPSIWPETSCISAIEALSAGCEVVTTNLGALYETCSPFSKLVGFDRNLDNLEKKYEKALKYSIENFWSKENQKKLSLQYEIMKSTYSWDVRAVEWENFLNEVRK